MSSSFKSFAFFSCLIQSLFYSKIVSGCLIDERRALLQFRSSLNDPEGRLTSWRGSECCSWRGVRCDNHSGSITGINLRNPYPNIVSPNNFESLGFWNLSGKISPTLLQLKSLERLDLSYNTFGGIPIPAFFGSLKKLRYMNLSKAGFTGTVPFQLGNLSRLQSLDLSSSFPPLVIEDFSWISGLSFLKVLSVNSVDLSMAEPGLFQALSILSLRELQMSGCGVAGNVHKLSLMNLTFLEVMDLSANTFNAEIPSWFANFSNLVYLDLSSAAFYGQIPEFSRISTLKYIDLSMNINLTGDISKLLDGNWRQMENIRLASNRVDGYLPETIGNFSSLLELNLFDNNIQGGIPSSIGKICNMRNLNLAGNNLTLPLPMSLEVRGCLSVKPLQNLDYFSMSVNGIEGILPEWLGELQKLTVLDLSYNMIAGPIPPSIGNLSLLTELRLDGNQLIGALPSTLGHLSKLEFFGISSNQLSGTVTEEHFLKLSSLKFLWMYWNSLTVRLSSRWVPPFQVRNLAISSCHLGPQFPSWIKTQKELKFLDISNTSISGKIPTWFWDISSNLLLLNISFNKLDGQIPNPMKIGSFADVDLRNNLFSGSIPTPSTQIELLDLSHNHFSGSIPTNFGLLQPYIIHLSLSNNNLSGTIPFSIGYLQGLQIINLSNNHLIGPIPLSLQNCSYLKALVLEHNILSGKIPPSLGSLVQLQTVHLGNNGLSGEIPQSLQKITYLETLDLRNNNLSGSIPDWLGDRFPSLRILCLRSNQLSGQIPFQLSDLKSLQVLDLANNLLDGTIPPSLGALEAMNDPKINAYLLYGHYRGTYYEESISINKNNRQLTFTKTLNLVTSIDLSGNKLSGELPQSLTELSGLIILDLSENNLTGKIPQNIGGMHWLESLDLSNNHMFGEIPASMGSISFLSNLNLSNNNFSGEIPNGGQVLTFPSSSFCGNPFLYSRSFTLDCNVISRDSLYDGEQSRKGLVDEWFYLSIGSGFTVGILGLLSALLIRKSWADAYFNYIDRLLGYKQQR